MKKNNETVVSFTKNYRRFEKRIAKEQHKLSLMVFDSKNYRKQSIKIAKLHAKAKHQRRDFLEQISARLTSQYDVISIENLDISAIKKALKFGKSVSDNGWGMFTDMLKRKGEKNGCLIVVVDKWFPSSKTCSQCGYIKKDLTLDERTYVCPVCGNIMDRDEQAGINLDREGLRIFIEAMTEDNDNSKAKKKNKKIKIKVPA